MIVLYGALIFSSVWFGVTLTKRLGEREKFYLDLVDFLVAYESNLAFRQDTIKDLVITQIEDSDLRQLVYKIICEEPELCIEYLTKKEIAEVKEMVLSLSRSGLDSGKLTVTHLKRIANLKLESASKQKKAYGSMSIKLSFFVGLLLVILLI